MHLVEVAVGRARRALDVLRVGVGQRVRVQLQDGVRGVCGLEKWEDILQKTITFLDSMR